ncbi:MAG: c-type cytochrome [Deltaproteobacteria bacterium]|nr:c-type cytochrome [bacterium]MCB9487341.1 c-type cytochrome [Deltaproteobacteria bacterium]
MAENQDTTAPGASNDEVRVDHGQLLDHNYDGIQEYDNPQPGWWSFIFFATFVFSIFYFIHYHGGGCGVSVAEKYEMAMAEANAQKAEAAKASGEVSADVINAFMGDQASMAQAKTIWDGKCAACHLPDGGGLIGPNMTDDYYLHGGDAMSIYHTIKKGVPEKGMIPWEGQLSEEEMMKMAAFVRNFRGKTAANPKAAEGELYTP